MFIAAGPSAPQDNLTRTWLTSLVEIVVERLPLPWKISRGAAVQVE